MQENRHKILKSSFGVAIATFVSRILGLARVMLEARVLGGGADASAWGFAFMLPNVFRRLLGEGALGAALIPLISHHESEHGIEKVRKELGVIFFVLGFILAVIVVVVSLFAIFCGDLFSAPYIKLAFKITPLVMPYSFFICLIGIAGAVLNTRRVFFLPALGALILNILLIGALGFFAYYKSVNFIAILNTLSYLVLISGVIQLGLMIILMIYYQIFPNFKWATIRKKVVVSELFRMALPGLIGGAALQVSLLVDRAIALGLGAEALPSLNYTERIIYLPVGIFAISIGSVLMADMSRAAANKNYDEMIDDLIFSLRHVVFVCLPMTFFIIVFRREIITALFFYGKFTESNVAETAWAMMFYTMGIPFFCATKVIVPIFYARKNFTLPMKVSLFAIVLNIILNFILMIPLRQGGLALATVISAIVSNLLLLYYFKRDGFKVPYGELIMTSAKTIIAATVASCLYFVIIQFAGFENLHFIYRLLILTVEVMIFSFIFLGMMYLQKSNEFTEISSLVKSAVKRKLGRSSKI